MLIKYISTNTLILFFVVSSAFHASAASEVWQQGSFSATRVEFDRTHKEKEKRSKVYVSNQGIREEEQNIKKPAERQFTVVVNFEFGKTWFLVPHRKIYMEPPSADAPGVTTSEEPGTVLAPSPCQGYSKSEKRGTRSHEERKVEEWGCHSDSTGDVTQLYDPALHVVVRSEDKKGRVLELRNISEGKQPDSLFKIPEGYRKATLREIMTGTTELPGYSEDGALGEKKK